MSNKELDSLFKSKLENLEKTPSADAWSKIQAQSQQKKPVWLWMRVAAAILLLLVSGIVVWNFTRNKMPTNDTLVANDTKPESTINEDTIIANSVEQSAKVEQSALVDPQTEDKTQVKKIESNSKQHNKVKPQLAENNNAMAQKNTAEEPLPEVNEIIEKSSTETLIAENDKSDATIENETASEQQATEGTTLVFNIEDFKKVEVAANASETESNTETDEPKKGINKVLNLMKELKSDAGIGDLREAKNEIFAFNFKKEKDDDSE